MSPSAVTQSPAGWNVAHVVVTASLITAALMLMTANELGPFGPLLIAEAIYLAAFAVTFEALVLAVQAWSFIRAAMLLRAAESPVTNEATR